MTSEMNMGGGRKGRRLIAPAVALAVLVAPTNALAAPLAPTREKSDNTMSFDYDADTGTIGTALSSRYVERRDTLGFSTYVRDDPEAEVGDRLLGIVQLTQGGKRAVKLDGTLSVAIENDEGKVIETLERKINIVLRPDKGKRSKTFRWRFDLGSGYYTSKGSFKS